jgi:hypothetical protein
MYGNLVGPSFPAAYTPLNFQTTNIPSALDYQRGLNFHQGGVLTSPKENPQLQMYLYNPFSNYKKAAAGNNISSSSRISATKLNNTISHMRSFSQYSQKQCH